jgi:YHS domain-containing protein/mono/diheme cytochrome c family protein
MLIIALALPALTATPSDEVDFLKDVWPIIEARCVECHGPDEQKGKLRLDTRAGMFGEDAEYPAVVPGKPEDSELWLLVDLPADDPDLMPSEGERLSAAELDLLERWIAEGADWAQPPVRKAAPDPLAIPPLSDEQVVARDQALARLTERGLHALPVAAGHPAVDVNFSLQRSAAGDAELDLLAGLEPALVWLNLSGTTVGDSGMATVARFGQLRRLNLSRTGVNDAGLAALAGLDQLTTLNLYGTRVSDAGLVHLEGLVGLEKLFLWQTSVTDGGAAKLAKALPGLEINRGARKLVAPAPAPTAGPVNAKCPVSGKDVDPACTSQHGDRLVAFCCGTCKGKFDADPAAFLDKLPEPAPSAGFINEVCPVSGKAVDPAHGVDFKGKRVGFCCAKCKAAFEKAPDKFAGKLGLKR